MPSIYPAAPPTLSGDLLSISRFLQSPTMLRRRLRTYVDLRFISDQILTNRYKSSGGAVLYEMSEPFLTARAVESVMPGQPYPESSIATGTGGLAEVTKWGQKVPLTDEEITRNVYGAQIVDRTLQKVVNSVIAQVDGVTMSGDHVDGHPDAGRGELAWDGSGGEPADHPARHPARREGHHRPAAGVQPGHAADDGR